MKMDFLSTSLTQVFSTTCSKSIQILSCIKLALTFVTNIAVRLKVIPLVFLVGRLVSNASLVAQVVAQNVACEGYCL